MPWVGQLDIRTAGITSLIWATGYKYDFGWVRYPVIDARGTPIHRRGITTVPGLYSRSSTPPQSQVVVPRGVGDDAAYLAQHIAARA